MQSEDDTASPSEAAATVQPPTPTLEACAEIALQADVLDYFAKEVERAGVVGEARLAKLLYLAVTSRLLPQPVSVAVKGPSSGGKSYIVGKVLGYFPRSAFYELSAMSEKSLIYSKEPLRHRFLVLYEAAGIKSGFAEYLIRSLLSEGRVRYETVERTADGSFGPRLIEREGPTGLIVTTTLASMHHENETRYLSVTVTDTREQTRHVLRALATDEPTDDGDPELWRTFQRWLETGRRVVFIPFASALVDLVDPVAVRLRRDFGKVLTLIRAHSLLHRASRRKDAQSRIIAELDDYRQVYELMADHVAEGVEATVPPRIRETVEAVARLTKSATSRGKGPSSADVGAALHLDRSAALRRVRDAIERGYLENLETRKGVTAQLVIGDPLPEERTILPDPDDVAARCGGCTVARASEARTRTDWGEDVADTA